MRNRPFFSIVIPTYNRATDLQFVIFCLLRQNFKDFEVIISDNHSTDNSESIVRGFKSKQIRYFKNGKNIGYAPNLRRAIRYAKGEYIFLHGDDDFLVFKDSLHAIYKKIIKLRPGFVRVNYLCRSFDRQSIFDFPPQKRFKEDKYLPPKAKIHKILSFIADSEPNFITGIIFKNSSFRNTKIINSEICPWIDVLLNKSYSQGAYFISRTNILASWSHRHTDIHGLRVFYDLINGKVQCESYLAIFRKYLQAKDYKLFQEKYLLETYVKMFPAIKFYIGNKNLIDLAKRIVFLNPSFAGSFLFKYYFTLSLLLPGWLLGMIRRAYLFKYIKFSSVPGAVQFTEAVRKVYTDFGIS